MFEKASESDKYRLRLLKYLIDLITSIIIFVNIYWLFSGLFFMTSNFLMFIVNYLIISDERYHEIIEEEDFNKKNKEFRMKYIWRR